MDSSIIWSAIGVQQVMNYMLNSLHCLRQVSFLELENTIFCLTLVAGFVGVSFLNE